MKKRIPSILAVFAALSMNIAAVCGTPTTGTHGINNCSGCLIAENCSSAKAAAEILASYFGNGTFNGFKLNSTPSSQVFQKHGEKNDDHVEEGMLWTSVKIASDKLTCNDVRYGFDIDIDDDTSILPNGSVKLDYVAFNVTYDGNVAELVAELIPLLAAKGLKMESFSALGAEFCDNDNNIHLTIFAKGAADQCS